LKFEDEKILTLKQETKQGEKGDQSMRLKGMKREVRM